MTDQIYLLDHYQKEFEAKIVSADGKFIVLDKSLFCPEGGGQPSDQGVIHRNGDEFKVINCKKNQGQILIEVDKEGLKNGDDVVGIVDWERRYKLMRSHTAAHVISGFVANKLGALITGNQLSLDGGRIDFNLEKFDKESMLAAFDECNKIIDQDLPVKIYWMKREDVEKNPNFVKLAMGLPPGIKELRIVDIVGFDAQPDGGTHISHLKEIGHVQLERTENKGKNNRRVYFKLI
ncbi:MAG: alanyl-tRNA editing protein [Nanoarchaeota archaeon]|nr:MAG: alanyl-tRNA editing protein [Nanoarchaeota archaeon]